MDFPRLEESHQDRFLSDWVADELISHETKFRDLTETQLEQCAVEARKELDPEFEFIAAAVVVDEGRDELVEF
jgi:hypothetical protein